MAHKKNELMLPAPDQDILKAAYNNIQRARNLIELSSNNISNKDLTDVYSGLLERLKWSIFNLYALIEIKEKIPALDNALKQKEIKENDSSDNRTCRKFDKVYQDIRKSANNNKC